MKERLKNILAVGWFLLWIGGLFLLLLVKEGLAGLLVVAGLFLFAAITVWSGGRLGKILPDRLYGPWKDN